MHVLLVACGAANSHLVVILRLGDVQKSQHTKQTGAHSKRTHGITCPSSQLAFDNTSKRKEQPHETSDSVYNPRNESHGCKTCNATHPPLFGKLKRKADRVNVGSRHVIGVKLYSANPPLISLHTFCIAPPEQQKKRQRVSVEATLLGQLLRMLPQESARGSVEHVAFCNATPNQEEGCQNGDGVVIAAKVAFCQANTQQRVLK